MIVFLYEIIMYIIMVIINRYYMIVYVYGRIYSFSFFLMMWVK